MDDGDLREYVERSQSLIEQSPQMNEDNTKARLIEPLIHRLGWDLRSLEVEREYTMQIGSGHARADYALLVDSTPVVFIEAKGCDGSLSESDESQLRSYMRQVGVDWGLLTNGKSFVVLKRQTDNQQPNETTLGEFPLTELPKYSHVIRLLSKKSVRSGESDKVAERLEASKQAVKSLQNDKSELADAVTDIIVERTDSVLTQSIEPLAKEFIDELVVELSRETHATGQPESVKSTSSQTATETVSPREMGKYKIVLSGDGETRTAVGENQAEAMVDAVGCLVESFKLVDEIGELPYIPGKKNALLNNEPEHPNGDSMRTWGETNGYFVNTSLNSKSKQRYLGHLAEMCGVDISFDGDW